MAIRPRYPQNRDVHISDLYQSLGLLAINAIARSADYSVTEISYGTHPRQRLDWYRLNCGMGHSAGAQLGALLTLNRSLADGTDRIRGFVGLSGPYDFYPFTEDDHWDLFGDETTYPVSQPVNYVRADAPPLYLLHGEEDKRVRRGHSRSLMEKQNTAGGTATREVYARVGHVDIIVQFSRLHCRNSRVVADVVRFLNDASSSWPDREMITDARG